MSEKFMQTLNDILQDRKLFNPDKTKIRINKDAYSDRYNKFGVVMEELIKAGIMLGNLQTCDIPSSIIWIKFTEVNPNVKTAELDYYINVEHRDKKVKKGQLQRTAVVTISFKQCKWVA